jgi:putative SOS response-associated peptidase YedK
MVTKQICRITHSLLMNDTKPPLKGEMWFSVTDQPVFAVAGFWQRTKEGNGFTMVTCDPTHWSPRSIRKP